jgi:hypothetical protein
MPLESRDARLWTAPLADRLAQDADAAQVANAVAAVWREIDAALYPIIGHGGVAALYNRSLNLTRTAFPWLGRADAGLLASVDPAALKDALAEQTVEEAAAGGSALLDTFRELLSSLIGPSLTDRLLRSVWAPSSGSPPAQDISP